VKIGYFRYFLLKIHYLKILLNLCFFYFCFIMSSMILKEAVCTTNSLRWSTVGFETNIHLQILFFLKELLRLLNYHDFFCGILYQFSEKICHNYFKTSFNFLVSSERRVWTLYKMLSCFIYSKIVQEVC